MKTLAAFSMCLNEIHLIELYLRSTLEYAAQVIIIDGCSTDGTLDVLADYRRRYPEQIVYTVLPQVGKPYSGDWNTGTRRQWCIDQARTDFVFRLDIDEIVSEPLRAALPVLLERLDGRALWLKCINFWSNFQTVRVNDPGDPRWEGIQPRIYPNTGAVRFRDEWHHSDADLSDLRHTQHAELEILHLHYADARYLKPFDNRRYDVNCTDNDFSCPDWTGAHITAFRIVTRPYTGGYPPLMHEMGYV